MEGETFHVMIIGAGICGLGAAISIALEGHRVTVFESAPQLHQVGAGIQITPNGVRLLRKWGVTEELKKKAAVPESLSILRYDGQRVLAYRPNYHEEIQSKYGEPIWCLHRVDLQRELARKAEELGVTLLYGSRVSHVDFDDTTIACENGRKEIGDIIIAADGIWSSTRSQFFAKPMLPRPTGDLAYRIILTAHQIDDAELRDIITTPGLRIWMGPGAHAVSYSLLGGEMFNIVLLVPDDLPEATIKSKGDLGEMARLFEGWDPLYDPLRTILHHENTSDRQQSLTKFLSYVNEVDKWRLMYLRLNEAWTSPQGTFVMAGDSCHPILPYMAQGANSALEDGATLGALLGRVKSREQIPFVTRIYESIRKNRIGKIREETFKHQEEFHLPDGEMQRARDLLLAGSFVTGGSDNSWTHPKIQPWLFGYDAYTEASKAYDSAV